MNYLEKIAVKIRHLPFLRGLKHFWNFVNPLYENLLKLFYGKTGLTRNINGTDIILVSPESRRITETYEPRMWKRLTGEVREGDIIADVGAFTGLYTVALAKKTGIAGKVVAFEPNPDNVAKLRRHVELNRISSRVEILAIAAGDKDGLLTFYAESDRVSHIVTRPGDAGGACIEVMSKTLDNIFRGKKLDIIKIDVEGYEEKVLLGAKKLLKREKGYPRAIFIEAHPYVWGKFECSSEKILSLLADAGYRLETASGEALSSIDDYCKIVALKNSQPPRLNKNQFT